MAWRTELKTEVKTREELLRLCGEGRPPIYVSSAEDNFDARVRQREDEGFSGAVYYRWARSMKGAEDELLEKIRRNHPQNNLQEKSDSPREPGYVYIIKGKKCRKGQLQTRQVATQTELHNLCHEDGSFYVGATENDRRDNRVREHKSNGFSGTFYYTDTQNMRSAEDKLLDKSPYGYLYNDQKKSNMQEKPGYIYLINGWRMASKERCLKTERKSQGDLINLCSEPGSIYVGATRKEDREARVEAFKESGFLGTFYYAEIENMREAEDALLKEKKFRWNTQTQSNRKEEPGIVYLIVGERHA